MAQNVYAIIGSNCFTGSHIIDALLEDSSNFVVGFSRSPEKGAFLLPYKRHHSKNFKFLQNDLVRQPDQLVTFLDEFQPSYIVNVAGLSEVGLSHFHPAEYFETNCVGVVRLANQLRSRKYLKRYIHISTPEAYGSCAYPLPETAPLNPSTPYAASKAAADMYLSTLHKNFEFPVVIMRYTNVYGKHQQLYKIIPRSIINLRKGVKTEMHGGGAAVKTWLHIQDVAQAVMATVQLGRPGEIYHFADTNTLSVAELVKKICELMGKDFEANTTMVGERLGQDAKYVLDDAKAQRELSWFPQIDFTQGLKETIMWLEENWHEVEKESLVYAHRA